MTLSPRLSASLNVARATAAFYVVAHHVASTRSWSDHGVGLLLRFGQEAVIIFFLLSGFVIFANEEGRPGTGYVMRRLRRIYPPLLIAMLVSVLVIVVYNGEHRSDWPGFFATLLNLQDVPDLKPGVIAAPFLDNNPLWSLSYEMAFYAAFPFILPAWRRAPALTTHLIGAGCCLAYLSYAALPNHVSLVAAYFLVWWSGAMAADAYGRGGRSVLSIVPVTAWLAALTGISALVVWLAGFRGLGVYPMLPLRHFGVALLVLVLCFGPLGRALATLLQPLARPAAWLASISYGVYVLHYPITVQWQLGRTPAGLALSLVILLVLAWLSDRVLDRWLKRRLRAVSVP